MALCKAQGYHRGMVKVAKSVEGAAGWHFTIEEVSYGHWVAEGHHEDGRSVSRHGGPDVEAVLGKCVEDAKGLPERRHV